MSKTMNDNWPGYTLDELRYRRARVAADNEASRIMLSRQADSLRRGNPVTRGWNTMRDILSAIGYVNSALFAFQLLRRARAMWRTFRR